METQLQCMDIDTADDSRLKDQRCTKRWNKILALVISIMAFLLLFSIVLVNVLDNVVLLNSINETITTSDTKQVHIGFRSGQLLGICSWDDICNITCNNLAHPISNFINEIDLLIEERIDCNTSGIHLEFKIRPYEKTLPSMWFKCNVKVIEFIFNAFGIDSVQEDAFNVAAFHTLKYFKLSNLKKYETGIFNGLTALETLMIDTRVIDEIDLNILDPLSTSLESLKFSQNDQTNSFELDGLTGGTQLMNSLKIINFNTNNFPNINKSSFKALTSVEYFDLSNAGIQSIEAGSFDTIQTTIRLINLQLNSIVLLSYVFDNLLPNNDLEIFIANNSLVCDCSQLPFQYKLNQYTSNFDVISECEVNHESNVPIIMGVECDETTTVNQPTEPTTESTTILLTESTGSNENVTTEPITSSSSSTIINSVNTTVTPLPATNENDENVTSSSSTITSSVNTTTTLLPPTKQTSEENPTSSTVTTESSIIEKKCQNLNGSNISNYLTIDVNNDIDFNMNIYQKWIKSTDVYIDLESISMDHSLFWFNSIDSADRLSDELHCVSNLEERSHIIIHDLNENTAYIFCLIKNSDPTMTPLNCQAFFVRSPNDNILLIVLFVIGLILCIFIGFISGYLFQKRMTKVNHTNDIIINDHLGNIDNRRSEPPQDGNFK